MHCFSLEWSYPCIAQLNHSKTSTIFRIHITARAMNEWMNEILMSRHEATGQFWPIWHWVGGLVILPRPHARQTVQVKVQKPEMCACVKYFTPWSFQEVFLPHICVANCWESSCRIVLLLRILQFLLWLGISFLRIQLCLSAQLYSAVPHFLTLKLAVRPQYESMEFMSTIVCILFPIFNDLFYFFTHNV